MIYCVVPQALADELYDKLADYYKEDPNVTVIIDRRKSSRRDRGSGMCTGRPSARSAAARTRSTPKASRYNMLT